MRVMGIDLSLTSTGIAVTDFQTLAATLAVKSSGKRSDTLAQREARLRDILKRIEAAVIRYQPHLAVVEAPSFGSVGGSSHDRSGLWWAVLHMLCDYHVPVAQVAPTQRAKYGTGNGRADKKVVHSLVQANYGGASMPIKTNDEADAVLLAAMGARHLGHSIEVFDIGDARREAMTKVVWP